LLVLLGSVFLTVVASAAGLIIFSSIGAHTMGLEIENCFLFAVMLMVSLLGGGHCLRLLYRVLRRG